MATVQQTSSGLPYVGNPDFRGYLSALAQRGDKSAAAALGYTGNDGGINNTALVNNTSIDAQGAAPQEVAAQNAGKSYVANAYKTFTGLSSGKVRGASTGSGTPNTNASDLAYLDSQDASLRDQLTRAQTGLDQGLTQIGDTYNEAATRNNQDKNTADTGYNTNRTNTTQDKLKAVDTLNTNARTLADSVRRMIGLASGQNSSAYQVEAPSAIARDTTGKRVDVNDTYKRNFDSIDNAQGASDLKFSRAAQDLIDQRKQKEEGLRSGVLQQQNDISSQLGQDALTRSEINGGTYAGTSAALQPIQNSITARQNAIDSLFAQYRTPYALADTTPVAANIDTYKTPTTAVNTAPAAPAAGQPAGAGGDLSSQLALILKKFQGAPAATTAAPAAVSTA